MILQDGSFLHPFMSKKGMLPPDLPVFNCEDREIVVEFKEKKDPENPKNIHS